MVSVIIPIFNCQEYLARCLDSIINQTYEDLEIILINDGSTDKSFEICKEYADRDKRVVVKSIENSGSSIARNEGIRISKGEYIMFVDSDDYIDSTLVEELLNAIYNNNVRISVALGRKVTTSGEKIATADILDDKIKVLRGREKILFIFDHVAPWAKLFKREIFDTFEFTKGIVHQDFDLIPKIVFEEERIAVIYKQLYTYVVRENSITGNNIKKRKTDLFRIIDKSLIMISDEGDEAELMRAQYLLHGYSRLKRVLALRERKVQKEYIKEYQRVYRRWLICRGGGLKNSDIEFKIKLEILLSCASIRMFDFILLKYLKSRNVN